MQTYKNDFTSIEATKPSAIEKPKRAVVLWNQNWVEENNPALFFQTLFNLSEHGIDFKLVVLGKAKDNYPAIFDTAKEKLSSHILHFGYVENNIDYYNWLWQCDILPVTAPVNRGTKSILEAMYCNVIPMFPNQVSYFNFIPEQFHTTFMYEVTELEKKLQRRIMDIKYVRVMDTNQYALRFKEEQ